MLCFDSEYYAYEEHEPVAHDATYLQEHFETLVPMGYENDCGGFGDVSPTLAGLRKTIAERSRPFEDYTTSTYEVQRWRIHSNTLEQRKEVWWQTPRTLRSTTGRP